MTNKLQPILVITATIGMIIFNYLAATGILGGIDPGAISDKYATRITPAGYAFPTIWSLIYVGMIAFSIYQILPKNIERLGSFRRIYILSCVANCAWLYFWHQEAVVVCLGIISILLGTLAIINVKLKTTESNADFWLMKFPFGIYFGWVTAATILNATIALVSLKVQLPASTVSYIAAGLILTAATLGVIIRLKLKNYFYPLAIAWALTAIAVKQSGQTLIVVSAAFGVIACLIAAVSFVMDMKSTEVRSI